MPRITLRQLGQYDASFEAIVEPDGRWQAEGGSYITHGRRSGRLSRSAYLELVSLATGVDLEIPHPIPTAEGFVTELKIGTRSTRWWGPPPTEALRSLSNALASLGA